MTCGEHREHAGNSETFQNITAPPEISAFFCSWGHHNKRARVLIGGQKFMKANLRISSGFLHCSQIVHGPQGFGPKRGILLCTGIFRTFPQLSRILPIFSACHMIWSVPNSRFRNFIYFRIPYFRNLVPSGLWSVPHLIVYSGFVANNSFIVL